MRGAYSKTKQQTLSKTKQGTLLGCLPSDTTGTLPAWSRGSINPPLLRQREAIVTYFLVNLLLMNFPLENFECTYIWSKSWQAVMECGRQQNSWRESNPYVSIPYSSKSYTKRSWMVLLYIWACYFFSLNSSCHWFNFIQLIWRLVLHS